ncbi:MAG: twin-arginine translocase subunit TatC, partial [Muribaculaceae bacterium]|nr:twin-arginine translocase subunit TatC [Muribaculaceae bacterium]
MSGESMTFWDHLDELRGVLVKIAVLIAVLATGCFIAMPWIFDKVILAPCEGGFPLYRWLDALSSLWPGMVDLRPDFHVDLVSVELTSQFMVHMGASLWLAFVLAFPMIIYLLWSFVAPGLYEREKRGARKAFAAGNVMFFLGMATGYFLVFPIAVRFLADYSLSDRIRPMVSLDSYMDNFFTLLLLMGAIFELPLVAWLLGRMGFLTRTFFSRYRRHAVVVLLVLAAAVTPTGDPFSLLAVFLPVYALWEFSR